MKNKMNQLRNSRIAALLVGFCAMSLNTSAQIFGGSINNLLNEVKSNWGTVLIITTAVFVIFNLGNFFGDNSDWKKGLRNFGIYLLAIGIGVALVKWAGGQSI